MGSNQIRCTADISTTIRDAVNIWNERRFTWHPLCPAHSSALSWR